MTIKMRTTLGKYRIESKLSEGGYSTVYQAMDTIEGIRVALKIPHPSLVSKNMLDTFRTEVRLVSKLEHPNILPLKNACFIDEQFVITYPLGEESLADRMRRRMSMDLTLDLCYQMTDAVAYAHEQGILHCDIKPENMILFPGPRLKLADFGIAKVAWTTIQGSGRGTIGHMAPEQAMGKPSQRSDVFAQALIIYRMFSGVWPEWPFRWPFDGYDRMKRRVHPEMIECLKRALDLNPKKRFRDGIQFQQAFRGAARKTQRKSQEVRQARKAC